MVRWVPFMPRVHVVWVLDLPCTFPPADPKNSRLWSNMAWAGINAEAAFAMRNVCVPCAPCIIDIVGSTLTYFGSFVADNVGELPMLVVLLKASTGFSH